MVNLHASKWFTVLVFIISLHPMIFAQVNEEWLARYNGKDNLFDGGHDVTVDAAGNVFITGQSVSEQTGSDFVTIKYDADGNELWSRSYNGNANLDDGGVSIAIDISGNVYVTGWSIVSENALAFATIKYSATGDELWVKSYIGPGNFRNSATSLAIDAAGNVYVTGVSTGLGSGDDYATIKYDPSGNELWVKRYNGPANSSDSPNSIAVSPDGNSYVTGGSVGVGSGLDYATIKYDSYGNELWVRRYNGPGNSLDAAHKIILDDLQNVYLTGESVGLGTQSDFATIKLNAAGAELWIRRYNGPLNLTDQAFALGLDRGRNVYVAGRSNSHQQVGDYVTLKYDAAGQEQWVRTYDGPISGNDIPWALAVEPSGNAYVTGSSTGADGKPDYATIAYNTTGNELWVKRFGPVKDSIDQATAIAVDGSGNVYVTGNSSDVEGGDDIVTIKYSQPGVFRVDAGQDKVIYLGYGPDCVTLSANVSNGNPPYTFVWSPGGTQSASISVCPSITTTYTLRVIDATGNIAIDEVVVKVVDVRCENNKVVICHNGKELCVPGHAVEAHLKHGDQLGTINCSKTDDLEKSFRITITPNPFQNRTFIQYEVPENGRVLINIFDDKGRLVSVVANGERKAGVYTTDFNAANLHKGIYYYSAILFTSKKGFVRTGKMIKIK